MSDNNVADINIGQQGQALIKTADVEAPTSTEFRKAAHQPSADPSELKKILVAKVFGSFHSRLIQWVQQLSRKMALLLLGALTLFTTAMGWLWQNSAAAKEFFLSFPYCWDARQSQYRPKQVEPTDMLYQYLRDEFDSLRRGSSDGMHNAWTEAQMRFALNGKITADDDELIRWFQKQAFGKPCWRQHPNSQVDHIGATSWVLLAFSRMGQKFDKSKIKAHLRSPIECLLSNQHSAGWWPQYPSQDDEGNASTYATALAVWALHELSKKNLIPQPQKVKAEAAIALGKDWLIHHSIKERTWIWRDYDGTMYGKESLGISGLVIHVLHTLGASSAAVDRAWMSHLPDDLPAVDEQVGSSYPVSLAVEGVANDATHNFTLPWLLIATIDAYPRGTLMQRAKAQRLFFNINGRSGEIQHKVFGVPWLAAELLMSLRYLQGDKKI